MAYRTRSTGSNALPKTVANERNQQQLNLIANNIGGTADGLRRQLAQVESGKPLIGDLVPEGVHGGTCAWMEAPRGK